VATESRAVVDHLDRCHRADRDVAAGETAHDAELSEYYRMHASSTINRARMDLRVARDPFDN
jgi:hypothetical protein